MRSEISQPIAEFVDQHRDVVEEYADSDKKTGRLVRGCLNMVQNAESLNEVVDQ